MQIPRLFRLVFGLLTFSFLDIIIKFKIMFLGLHGAQAGYGDETKNWMRCPHGNGTVSAGKPAPSAEAGHWCNLNRQSLLLRRKSENYKNRKAER